MNNRERAIKALRFEHPDRAPRDLWTLPGVEMFCKDELEALLKKYPIDIARPPSPYGPVVTENPIRLWIRQLFQAERYCEVLEDCASCC